MNLGIFYASNKGFASQVARQIADKLSIIETFDIKDIDIQKMSDYNKLVLVVSTHGDGLVQRDLVAKWDDFLDLNWQGKTVALVGLGDGVEHGDTFNNALGTLYDALKEKGAVLVGSSEITTYNYDHTDSVRDGKFPGLALDLPNQEELTEGRINTWLEQVKPALA